MIYRLYYEYLGGHVHCRLFAGVRDGSLGKCGDLTFREEEFGPFMQSASSFMQFREETRKQA